MSKSKSDSAFKYFNRAKDDFIQHENFSLAGSCLVNMAIIQNYAGDFYGSRESGLAAIKYLNKKSDSLEIVGNFNNLGIACQNLRDYKRAAEFYDNAAEFATPKAKLTLLNNKAISYVYNKNYIFGINIFKRLLKSPYIGKDTLYSKVYDNLAYANFLKNSNYNSEKDLIKALEIRTRIKDYDGLNASLLHLTEYYEKKDPSQALIYAKENLKIAKHNKSPDDQLTALKNIVLLEDSKNVKNYFLKYQILNDSLNIKRNKAKNQFALERFDAEKYKNQTIEKENQLLQQYIILFIIVSALIITIISFRKRQIRLKQEKELEVKNTQLKMSKKVHDVVANGIYQVMAKIENQEDFDRNKALDELEFVYEKSRDLSYEKAGEEKEFSQEISELIAGFNNTTVKTFTAGNDPSVWEKVSPAVKEEVYQMIRELMVNMKKHSQASHVAVKFEKTGETVEIQYKDNGVGISGDLIYKNGLRNTASRIEAIGGTITFDTKIEKGLKVNLSFPSS